MYINSQSIDMYTQKHIKEYWCSQRKMICCRQPRHSSYVRRTAYDGARKPVTVFRGLAGGSSGEDGSDVHPITSTGTQSETSWQQRMRFIGKFVTSNFLPLALTSAICLGMFRPEMGAAAAKTQFQSIVVVAIFVVSGLQLKRGEAILVSPSLPT